MIYYLRDLSIESIKEVGGKAANLGELMKLNINVPDGFVIRNDIDVDKIYKSFDDLNLTKVAVRSSAMCEDGEQNSFAGQFETILKVEKPNLIKSINKCFNSSNKDNVQQYAAERNVSKCNMEVAVIVQEMVEGDISGVMFTKNPINKEDEFMIEYTNGLGEGLVQGEVIPSQIIVDKNGLIKQSFGRSKLQQKFINELISIGLKVEEHFLSPRDIEWTIKNDRIYILQSRPVSIFNNKEA